MTNALKTIDISALDTVNGGRGGYAPPMRAPVTINRTYVNRTTVVAPPAGGGMLGSILSTAAGTAGGVVLGNAISNHFNTPAPAPAAPATTVAPAPAPAAH